MQAGVQGHSLRLAVGVANWEILLAKDIYPDIACYKAGAVVKKNSARSEPQHAVFGVTEAQLCTID